MNNYEFERMRIEILLDSDDLSLEQLLNIKSKMLQLNYSQKEISDVDDMLEDCFDSMDYDELIEAKKQIKSMNLDTSLVEKYIRRKSKLTNELVNSMDKDDILYALDCDEVPLETLLYIKKISLTKNFSREDIISIDESIDELIDYIYTYEELKNVLNLFNKYGIYNEKLETKYKQITSKYSEEKLKYLDSQIEQKHMEEKQKKEMTSFNVHIKNSVCGELFSCDLKKYLQIIPVSKQ